MKLSPQNSVGELRSQTLVRSRALRELNDLRALLIYSVFEDKKWNVSDKNPHKKTTGLT